jgi:hypothetical protein
MVHFTPHARVHETSKLNFIFGCRDLPDRIDRYIICPILWSTLHEFFGGDFPPNVFARINFLNPCERNLYILAAAFEIYHAIKIGLRGTVDEAVTSQRFADTLHHARVLARDHAHRLHARERLANHDSEIFQSSDSLH